MKFQLHYPFKHFFVTQKWGNPNPAYAQFGFTKHNGVDCISGYANTQSYYAPTTWPVWCPVEGFRVDKVQYRENGGGNEMWLISKEPLEVGDKTCYVYLVLAHAEKIFLKAGDEPKIGELMMIADSTGFSTGAHTHIGMYRVDKNVASWTSIDQNEANGSHDPALYFTGKYAIDIVDFSTLLRGVLRYAQYYTTGS